MEQVEDGQRRDIAWRLAAALQVFWVVYGYVREGQRFVERALVSGEGITAPVRAKALNGAGWLAIWQGEYVRVEVLCQKSLQLYRELHEPRGMGLALYRLGVDRLDARRLSRGHLPARGKPGTGQGSRRQGPPRVLARSPCADDPRTR